MHANKSTHWTQAPPFIQWCCNTQVHHCIGGRMPYQLMFGQNPQVGISNLPFVVLESLATEMDVYTSLGLPPDIPLEDATIFHDESKKTLAKQKVSRPTFHSEGFKIDVTDKLISILKKKATGKTGKMTSFGWK